MVAGAVIAGAGVTSTGVVVAISLVVTPGVIAACPITLLVASLTTL
jgi:hypothetical protein